MDTFNILLPVLHKPAYQYQCVNTTGFRKIPSFQCFEKQGEAKIAMSYHNNLTTLLEFFLQIITKIIYPVITPLASIYRYFWSVVTGQGNLFTRTVAVERSIIDVFCMYYVTQWPKYTFFFGVPVVLQNILLWYQ